MPRPKSKSGLLEAMSAERAKLEALLGTLREEQLAQAGVCGEWSVKDILAHLVEWQQMVLRWYRAGERGEAVKTPAPDLNWSQTPILNQRIYEKYRDTALAEIQRQFAASYAEIRAQIADIVEEKLVEKKVYPWTNTSTLLSYFVSATSSHDQWAYTEIRKWLKAQPT